ncbi:MAG: altronate dehydratase [Salinivirgaceae bacterium]|nr:altronate dehydratase [Salinivirgaceae bacterium]
MAQYIRINQADNVAVALAPLKAGTPIDIDGVVLRDDIPAGHKFALCNLSQGDNVVKYGFPIGHVMRAVDAGCHIDHNILKTNLEGVSEYTYTPNLTEIESATVKRSFKGFKRANGDVGIRNQIWIIPTVGCVNGIAQKLAERFSAEVAGRMGSVDAIVAFPHNYGCSQLGGDHENTRKILRNMVLHPNAGGVLVVGLGCENNQMSAFRPMLGNIDESRIKIFEAQKVSGDEVEYGLGLLREIFAVCSKDVREDVPMSELRVGLKCGGSDGLSGITANPLLGTFSDWIVAQGGTTVLTEVPEMFGAETILMNRCQNRATFDKTVALINDFKNYFIANNQPVYENPSPGNKAGGISTLEEKSLGCTQKCGTSTVRDVLCYGQTIENKGLNLLSAPGNDLVASTALAASGCQLVLFTTGRGTPFGTFVPTLKIATNTPLYRAKPNWIDFNAGVIADGEPMDKVAERFIDFVIAEASGQAVNNEKNGYREFAIFKTGVTL